MRLGAIIGPIILAAVSPVLLSLPANALNVCADPDYLPYSNRAGDWI